MNAATPGAAPPPFLAVEEIARLLGVSTRTVWRLRSEGAIPQPVKLRGSVRWDATVFRKWIADGCPVARKLPRKRK